MSASGLSGPLVLCWDFVLWVLGLFVFNLNLLVMGFNLNFILWLVNMVNSGTALN